VRDHYRRDMACLAVLIAASERRPWSPAIGGASQFG